VRHTLSISCSSSNNLSWGLLKLLILPFLPEGVIGAGEAGEEAEADDRIGPHPGVGHQVAGQARPLYSAPPGSQVLGLCHLKILTVCATGNGIIKKTTIFLKHIFLTSKVIRVVFVKLLIK